MRLGSPLGQLRQRLGEIFADRQEERRERESARRQRAAEDERMLAGFKDLAASVLPEDSESARQLARTFEREAAEARQRAEANERRMAELTAMTDIIGAGMGPWRSPDEGRTDEDHPRRRGGRGSR